MAKLTPLDVPIHIRIPWLYDKQAAFVYDSARLTCIEASTKSGKTHACIAWLLGQAFQGEDGDEYWWVAPVSRQAKIAWKRMSKILRTWKLPKNSWRATKKPDYIIELPTGATITFLTSEIPDNLYGENVSAIVVDEASRVSLEAWECLQSTIFSTSGPAKLIGNRHGTDNWFYRLCMEAKKGEDDDLSYHILTCWDSVVGFETAPDYVRNILPPARRRRRPGRLRQDRAARRSVQKTAR